MAWYVEMFSQSVEGEQAVRSTPIWADICIHCLSGCTQNLISCRLVLYHFDQFRQSQVTGTLACPKCHRCPRLVPGHRLFGRKHQNSGHKRKKCVFLSRKNKNNSQPPEIISLFSKVQKLDLRNHMRIALLGRFASAKFFIFKYSCISKGPTSDLTRCIKYYNLWLPNSYCLSTLA